MIARHDFAALNQADPLPDIALRHGIKLKPAGAEFKACCPFHDERSPSFTIYPGARGWRFHCHGCGAGGDGIDFKMRLQGVSLREATAVGTDRNLPAVQVIQPAPEPREDRLVEARVIWRGADPVRGTLAERYLRSRAITIAIPDSIRFAWLPYGKRGPLHPCLVAAVASVDNRLIGIQRTYLNADGTGKANVPKAKLSLGGVSGGAIRLAPCARSMIVCEGLEDGLTLMQELGRAVWVAAGAGNLPRMRFPQGAQAIAIGGDGDDAGRTAARKAADAYQAAGLRSRTFFPVDAKDFNAELMGRAQS